MSGQGKDHVLIKHILTLLEVLQKRHIEIEDLLEDNACAEALARQEGPAIQLACESIRFMDEMPGGFLVYYANGGEEVIYANRALLRIFQCATMQEFREYTGNSFQGMVYPEDLELVEQSIRNQIASSQYDLDYVEYRICRKDGALRWIEDYGHFVRNREGRDFFYVFLGDATEKRQQAMLEMATLLQEKEQNEQKLQNIIKEHMLIKQEHLRRLEIIEGLSINYESILYVDLEDNTILPYRLSRRTEVQFGEKFQPKPYSWYFEDYVKTWVHLEDQEMVRKATSPGYIQEKLAMVPSFYINYRVIDRGEELYLQLRLVNVGRGSSRMQAVMGYRRVDEEVRLEMEQKQMLAEALDKANLAIVARNTFLSNMSHDMRTPLNAIFGFTALAKKNIQDGGAVRAYLDRVEGSSRLLLDFIDKLLELSWTGSNEGGLDEKECDLVQVMHQAYNMLCHQAAEKDITFSVDCGGVQHQRVYSDQQKLRQVILYLAQNAITYTKPGGNVSLLAIEQEKLPNGYSVYQLEVRDTGVGIGDDFLGHLFEPFAREKNTTFSGVHGMGLGLTITKHIVDMLRGTIEVESQIGKGTAFTVSLRLRTHKHGEEEAVPVDGACARTGRLRILLVEDNEINLEIETEILQGLGYYVDTAVDGRAAVEKLRQSAPGDIDLVLMDLQMPVMDGWQAAKEIRRLVNPAVSGVPIVALSANVLEGDIQRAIESGMDAHLPKPLDISQLLKTVEDVMKKRGRPFGPAAG